MQTYHYDEIVANNQGVVTIAGLPPLAKVSVMVISPKPLDWQETMQQWIEEMKGHPFAKMSKREILERLQQSREKIYQEDYEHRHAN